MKKRKKIFVIVIAAILVLSTGLVVFAETNTSEQEKAEKPLLSRITSKVYWQKGLGLVEMGVKKGMIEEDTAQDIKDYFQEKKENKVSLLQELVDEGLISAQQKEDIEAYIADKKANALSPLEELLENGVITQEEYDELQEYAEAMREKAVRRISGNIVKKLIDEEIITTEELKAIMVFLRENKELISASEDGLLEILVDNELLTEAQRDQILELKEDFTIKDLLPKNNFKKRPAFGMKIH